VASAWTLGAAKGRRQSGTGGLSGLAGEGPPPGGCGFVLEGVQKIDDPRQGFRLGGTILLTVQHLQQGDFLLVEQIPVHLVQ
jgi:hypothetical protein